MFAKYIEAIWADVVARLSGLISLAFTGAGVYSQAFSGVLGGANAKKFWWLAAAGCFAYANYRVWVDQYKKVRSERPDFQVRIENIYYEYSQGHNNTVLIFALSLINRGARSITRGWRGTIEVNGCTEEMSPIHITSDWVMRIDDQTVTLRPQDLITTKTVEYSMEAGEGKVGRVVFTLDGDRREMLKALNYRVVIAFNDAFGNPWYGTFMPNPKPVVGLGVFPNEQGSISATPTKRMRKRTLGRDSN
jgi:hypothetical protein